ncbi:N-acetyltransferase [Photobacterium jeanii]|nr:GNAT family N-acetyltransferase [Photobacterium jeanii]PST92014.1 N-acetyltransferase [Photobacterium jeanii]
MTTAINYHTRLATDDDYEFLFELKKQAEYEPIKAVFGWDETVQRRIHAEEWFEERPWIIEQNGVRIGSFLIQDQGEHFYFCRFFILPAYQGKGIGSAILHHAIARAKKAQKPITLSYLQGNRVGELYLRHGFVHTGEDKLFVYMSYPLVID